jgi:hypothetical protein
METSTPDTENSSTTTNGVRALRDIETVLAENNITLVSREIRPQPAENGHTNPYVEIYATADELGLIEQHLARTQDTAELRIIHPTATPSLSNAVHRPDGSSEKEIYIVTPAGGDRNQPVQRAQKLIDYL